MALTKWQEDSLKTIESESNHFLLSNTLYLASGDDYDGGMTDRGRWEFNARMKELVKRLGGVGFLSEEGVANILEHHV